MQLGRSVFMWGLVTLFFVPAALHAEDAPLSSASSAYSFSFTDIQGNDLPLSSFKGKVVLVVNTASHCGYTPQYKDLQTLYETYKDKGFVVLGVPSGDFGGQEFGTEKEVQSFTEQEYTIAFPLTSITKVSGSEAHPFYAWAGEQAGFWGHPQWNFHKYLIGRDGHFAGWFSTATVPTSSVMIEAIEKELTSDP